MKTDLDLLEAVLDADRESADDAGRPSLFQREREAFAGMRDRARDGRALSEAQIQWIQTAAQRLGVVACAPAANVFSRMSPERQREERRLAKRHAFEDLPRALKPPGRT